MSATKDWVLITGEIDPMAMLDDVIANNVETIVELADETNPIRAGVIDLAAAMRKVPTSNPLLPGAWVLAIARLEELARL